MSFILVLISVVTLALSAFSAPPKEVGSQYLHLGDNGEYSYGYNTGNVVKEEKRSIGDTVHGAYSYVDANNEVQTVQYTADDKNGFVATASNLPKQAVGTAATKTEGRSFLKPEGRNPIQSLTQLLLPTIPADVTVDANGAVIARPPPGNPILNFGQLFGTRQVFVPVPVPYQGFQGFQGYQPQVPYLAQWCGAVPCSVYFSGRLF